MNGSSISAWPNNRRRRRGCGLGAAEGHQKKSWAAAVRRYEQKIEMQKFQGDAIGLGWTTTPKFPAFFIVINYA
jgi:hypothetical protein